ncbi:DNA-directed DNA polymerase [Caerostris extrusa]|uniref:DNA-directed DNA polymerase n=1 Tax=Caerostris extrusa TaxID=172846 RepID=A0AAV4SRR2_CAEEX|nr:DNA-directed DNA polymerase [Caerostris extrusa]
MQMGLKKCLMVIQLVKNFCAWLFTPEHKGFTAIAHNMKGSDVDILRRCCLEFRGQFQEITQVDPFQYVTIASACMAVFRSLHVTPNTIAMVPIHGMFLSRMSNLLRSDSAHPLKGISMATVKEKTDMTSAVLRSEGFKSSNFGSMNLRNRRRQIHNFKSF